MLRPALGMILRSQRRQGLAKYRPVRAVNGVWRGYIGRESPLGGTGIELTLEMRSYELGWLLFSFGNRIDYPALTMHPAFAQGASVVSTAGPTTQSAAG